MENLSPGPSGKLLTSTPNPNRKSVLYKDLPDVSPITRKSFGISKIPVKVIASGNPRRPSQVTKILSSKDLASEKTVLRTVTNECKGTTRNKIGDDDKLMTDELAHSTPKQKKKEVSLKKKDKTKCLSENTDSKLQLPEETSEKPNESRNLPKKNITLEEIAKVTHTTQVTLTSKLSSACDIDVADSSDEELTSVFKPHDTQKKSKEISMTKRNSSKEESSSKISLNGKNKRGAKNSKKHESQKEIPVSYPLETISEENGVEEEKNKTRPRGAKEKHEDEKEVDQCQLMSGENRGEEEEKTPSDINHSKKKVKREPVKKVMKRGAKREPLKKEKKSNNRGRKKKKVEDIPDQQEEENQMQVEDEEKQKKPVSRGKRKKVYDEADVLHEHKEMKIDEDNSGGIGKDIEIEQNAVPTGETKKTVDTNFEEETDLGNLQKPDCQERDENIINKEDQNKPVLKGKRKKGSDEANVQHQQKQMKTDEENSGRADKEAEKEELRKRNVRGKRRKIPEDNEPTNQANLGAENSRTVVAIEEKEVIKPVARGKRRKMPEKTDEKPNNQPNMDMEKSRTVSVEDKEVVKPVAKGKKRKMPEETGDKLINEANFDGENSRTVIAAETKENKPIKKGRKKTKKDNDSSEGEDVLAPVSTDVSKSNEKQLTTAETAGTISSTRTSRRRKPNEKAHSSRTEMTRKREIDEEIPEAPKTEPPLEEEAKTTDVIKIPFRISTSAPKEDTANKQIAKLIEATAGTSRSSSDSAGNATGRSDSKTRSNLIGVSCVSGTSKNAINRLFGLRRNNNSAEYTSVEIQKSLRPSPNVLAGFLTIPSGQSFSGTSTNNTIYCMMEDGQLSITISGLRVNSVGKYYFFLVPKDAQYSLQNDGENAAILSFTKMRSL